MGTTAVQIVRCSARMQIALAGCWKHPRRIPIVRILMIAIQFQPNATERPTQRIAARQPLALFAVSTWIEWIRQWTQAWPRPSQKTLLAQALISLSRRRLASRLTSRSMHREHGLHSTQISQILRHLETIKLVRGCVSELPPKRLQEPTLHPHHCSQEPPP